MPFTDEQTGEKMTRLGLRLFVTEVNGDKVTKVWNLLSKFAIQTLRPWIEDGSFTRKVFTVTKEGTARQAKYSITVSE